MHVSASTTIAAPISDVFAYVDKWENALKFTEGLTKWEPAGEITHGLNSSFAAALKLGPTNQESVLLITKWEEDMIIAWEPQSGFQQSGAYEFEPAGAGTKVTFTLDITLPGGIAGRLLGKTVEPVAKITVSKSLSNLKSILEA